MHEEIEVLREHATYLGLDRKEAIERQDVLDLSASLLDADELSLSKYVKNLTKENLRDLLVDTLFGDAL